MTLSKTDLIAERMQTPALLEGFAEEAAELAQAALKLARVIRKENPTPVTAQAALDSLIEEMADVYLYSEMTTYKLRISLWDVVRRENAKEERWLQRLAESEKRSCTDCYWFGRDGAPCFGCKSHALWQSAEKGDADVYGDD